MGSRTSTTDRTASGQNSRNSMSTMIGADQLADEREKSSRKLDGARRWHASRVAGVEALGGVRLWEEEQRERTDRGWGKIARCSAEWHKAVAAQIDARPRLIFTAFEARQIHSTPDSIANAEF
jgi:hypothetical protein